MTAIRRMAGALGLIAVAAGACGESKYDIYMKGAAIEGEASRNACKLDVPEGAAPAPISGDKVATCLAETKKAIAYYDQAADQGYDDPDFLRVRERAHERQARLESMLGMVRAMEREQAGTPPAPDDPLQRKP